MSHTKEDSGNSQIKLTITVLPAEYQKQLERAAERLSTRSGVRGFRPGKAPFDTMKRTVGDMAILQEALEPIIQESFYAVVKADALGTIGMPKIDIQKIAPGNDLVYTAIVAVLPRVTVADVSKIKIERTEPNSDEKKVEETIAALRGMRAVEKKKDDAIGPSDKAVIDMNMTLDHVPVEGGQAKDYQVYLSEDHYIPGFNKELLGLKAGNEKKFMLTFPDTHYQKMLAGKTVAFDIKVKEVFERTLPEADDAFAERLGQSSLEKLRALLTKNMQEEANQKADQQTEIRMLDTLIAASSFDAIPDILIDAERQKMFLELKRDLEKNGVTIEQYLTDIKKKEEELFNEFKAQAEKRAKAALLSRTVAKEQNIAATQEEIDQELKHLTEHYREDAAAQENLRKPEVRDSIASMIQNRKVMAWFKERVLTSAAAGAKTE